MTVPPGPPTGPRSSRAADWPVERLVALKGGTRVSVVLPARDEAATVGAIVARLREALVDGPRLVDEVVVVDSRSTDATAAIAAAAGARVVDQDRVVAALVPPDPADDPADGPGPATDGGKGEALWAGLAATTGDLVVFLDADLRDFDPAFVTGLLGPLLADPGTAFVKAFYRRPLRGDDDGGRVSELVARPLLAMHWPELAGVVQPLAGECAARRDVLEAIPFTTGYGVELGMLVDVHRRVGLAAMAQVDLGHRIHRHQDLAALGRMATQVMLAAERRLGRTAGTVLTQYRRPTGAGPRTADGPDRDAVVTDVAVGERPPLRTLAAVRDLGPAAPPRVG